jgi:hypothetical protein
LGRVRALSWNPIREIPPELALLKLLEEGRESYHIDKCKVLRLRVQGEALMGAFDIYGSAEAI